jgi:hypothetical protein
MSGADPYCLGGFCPYMSGAEPYCIGAHCPYCIGIFCPYIPGICGFLLVLDALRRINGMMYSRIGRKHRMQRTAAFPNESFPSLAILIQATITTTDVVMEVIISLIQSAKDKNIPIGGTITHRIEKTVKNNTGRICGVLTNTATLAALRASNSSLLISTTNEAIYIPTKIMNHEYVYTNSNISLTFGETISFIASSK